MLYYTSKKEQPNCLLFSKKKAKEKKKIKKERKKKQYFWERKKLCYYSGIGYFCHKSPARASALLHQSEKNATQSQTCSQLMGLNTGLLTLQSHCNVNTVP